MTWSETAVFPYKIDYNDHFETKLEAYQDILPLVDYVASEKGDRDSHVLYDPYYCNGRTKLLLRELGFAHVMHERRDFYKDVREQTVPIHHTLITNPPYSHQHKEKCLEFALKQLREKKRSFFVLMPNYVASKEYYRRLIGKYGEVVYVVPRDPYEYDHPDGTGHGVPPFASIWFCGIGAKRVAKAKELWKLKHDSARLATSLQELQQMGVIPNAKRPNPKQRKKRRKQMTSLLSSNEHGGAADSTPSATSQNRMNAEKRKYPVVAPDLQESCGGKCKMAKKKSRHRGADGVRTRKRF